MTRTYRKVCFEHCAVAVIDTFIPKEERHPNLEYAFIRHGDDPSIPVSVQETPVVVNFWGMMISHRTLVAKRHEPLDLNQRYRREFRFGGEEITEEYLPKLRDAQFRRYGYAKA
jgi:hypothetical protein